MRNTVSPADLDPKRLKALRALFSAEELTKNFNMLIEDIKAFSQEKPSSITFLDQAHAQLGAALNLGALCIAGTLRAIERRSIDHDQAMSDLHEALSALRAELKRQRVFEGTSPG